MGYLRAWKQNLATLVVVAVVVAGVAIIVVVAHHSPGASAIGPGDRASSVVFSVSGSAPDGVVVSEGEDSGPPALLARKARLPYRAAISTDGSSFYRFEAQLRGEGQIRCTVRIGAVVEVKHASGRDAACTPGVGENTRSPGWHGE